MGQDAFVVGSHPERFVFFHQFILLVYSCKFTYLRAEKQVFGLKTKVFHQIKTMHGLGGKVRYKGFLAGCIFVVPERETGLASSPDPRFGKEY
jgi:hypothetical protein